MDMLAVSPSTQRPGPGGPFKGWKKSAAVLAQGDARALTEERPLCHAYDGSGQQSLTPREHEVLQLVAEGRSNKGIGDRLGVSERAVQKHVTAVFGKFDLPAGEDDNRRILAVLEYVKR